MSSKLLSASLFVTSAMAFLLTAFRSVSAMKKLKKAVINDYKSTLQNLFKVVKTAPRHEINDIFLVRKQHFLKHFSSVGLSKETKIIHVAGSKGKGSTVEFVASALRESGYSVGVFTSPHLHSARERIKIGEKLISVEDFVRLGQKTLTHTSNLTWVVFFDLLLLTALEYFGEKKVDYIVLEAGIGGRYDSTNFVPVPEAAIITSISLDHQAMLGNTIEEIAYQKAGIIKENCHIFTPASQPESVLNVFRKCCRELNATLHEVSSSRWGED